MRGRAGFAGVQKVALDSTLSQELSMLATARMGWFRVSQKGKGIIESRQRSEDVSR